MDVKVAVVGGGPAGRTTAIALSKKGIDVDLYEKDKIGGTCLNYGCTYITGLREMADVLNILSSIKGEKIKLDELVQFNELQEKINKIQKRIRKKLEKETINAGVNIKYKEFKDKEDDYDYTVYATGKIYTNTFREYEDVLTHKDIPQLKDLPENILVIGGGTVGVEYASLFADFGSEVVLYARSRILKDITDEDIRNYIMEKLINFKIIHKEEELKKFLNNEDYVKILAIGGKGRFKTDKYLRVLNEKNTYACGDCLINGGGNTPVSRMEGRTVAENIYNEINGLKLKEVKYNLIPKTVRLSLTLSYVGKQTKEHKTIRSSVGKGNFFKVLSDVGINRIYYENGKVVGAISTIPASEVLPYFAQFIKGLDVYNDFIEIHPSTDIFYKEFRRI
ncbi:FAD-dependent pyridine nucleotide-disulphide oxidoreductase [Methanocaldococcus vulcanius M7]|uniref:FAD-dependent pyridine nucleotide-disulphide oxidoreductase n=1 Tax=Methanocaldococcus vulcanius (strain ATCC 700851 / DSM 12094 / M7) TaxID=579137 RepID=C9RHW3_METVM|nr:FAD-dependent oxidoreductase [Methanocaldococcus vulcanius]ACX73165.1 FAD-dependent pyridine nucleotide-disulphide oxidoreductase [Methanocaldococcus vulcanius M7]